MERTRGASGQKYFQYCRWRDTGKIFNVTTTHIHNAYHMERHEQRWQLRWTKYPSCMLRVTDTGDHCTHKGMIEFPAGNHLHPSVPPWPFVSSQKSVVDSVQKEQETISDGMT